MKKRILMVFGEPFYHGGQEAFALNLYKFINHKKFYVDFYTPYEVLNDKALNLLKDNGSNIFNDNYKFESRMRKKYFIKGFNNFIKKHCNDYDIVHINSGSTFVLVNGAKIAKNNGIKMVVVHSHAFGVLSLKHKITNKIQEKGFKYADKFLACSKLAAEFRFPLDIINDNKYTIVSNGIDLDLYKFNINIRNKYRADFKINNNEILLCNVGRLSFEKNQFFVLDVLESLNKRNNIYKLLLVGEGPDEFKIRKIINEKNLNNNVIILSKRDDVNNLLMASDLFLFPSIYEGLGIAALEAIASGLPVIMSNNVPIDNNKFSAVYKLDCSNLQLWINKILKLKLQRVDNLDSLEKNLFSVKSFAKCIEKIYEDI